MLYPALLPLMRTPRLPAVDWTDAPTDLNGLVRFAERLNLVSARVPSYFNWPLPHLHEPTQMTFTAWRFSCLRSYLLLALDRYRCLPIGCFPWRVTRKIMYTLLILLTLIILFISHPSPLSLIDRSNNTWCSLFVCFLGVTTIFLYFPQPCSGL